MITLIPGIIYIVNLGLHHSCICMLVICNNKKSRKGCSFNTAELPFLTIAYPPVCPKLSREAFEIFMIIIKILP